jgi:hypothetical protein
MMKFSQAISQVKWLSSEETNISKTVSVFILIQTSTLRTRTEMVFEMLVFSLLNHLSWLIARENFFILGNRIFPPLTPKLATVI